MVTTSTRHIIASITETLPLEKLEDHIAQNKKKGDAALPAGRSTTDTHEPPQEREKVGVRQRQRRMRKR